MSDSGPLHGSSVWTFVLVAVLTAILTAAITLLAVRPHHSHDLLPAA